MAEVEQRPWPLRRVIQMIDENKEQLRNLFRNYNVLDVQPAISVRLPDDMSALQVPLLGQSLGAGLCPRNPPADGWPAVSTDGHHCPSHPSLLGCHALRPHELVLQDRVSDSTFGLNQKWPRSSWSAGTKADRAKDQR